MPDRAITMGVGTILEGRRCLLLATGAEKAAIVAQAVEGPLTSMVNASALQLHPACPVVLNEAAAGQLKQADDYHWLFENKPAWESLRNVLRLPVNGKVTAKHPHDPAQPVTVTRRTSEG